MAILLDLMGETLAKTLLVSRSRKTVVIQIQENRFGHWTYLGMLNNVTSAQMALILMEVTLVGLATLSQTSMELLDWTKMFLRSGSVCHRSQVCSEDNWTFEECQAKKVKKDS